MHVFVFLNIILKSKTTINTSIKLRGLDTSGDVCIRIDVRKKKIVFDEAILIIPECSLKT